MRGPTAEQIRQNQDASVQLSAQKLSPELAVSIEIVASETIPWGGIDVFYAHQASKNTYSSKLAHNEEPSSSSSSPPTSSSNEPASKEDWACTFCIARISFGAVTKIMMKGLCLLDTTTTLMTKKVHNT